MKELKKRNGERKAKDMGRKHDAAAALQAATIPESSGTDRPDLIAYKMGSQSDRNHDPSYKAENHKPGPRSRPVK